MNKEKLEKENAELKEKILLERCSNCEKTYHEYGKGCAWRSLGNEYCFDGMNNAEANAEITRNFNHFQTEIARGFVQKAKGIRRPAPRRNKQKSPRTLS